MNWRVVCIALCMLCLLVPYIPLGTVHAEQNDYERVDVPAKSLISAHNTLPGSTPQMAADGNLATAWNAGRNSGVISFVFNQDIKMNGIEIAATSYPTSTFSYLIYGLNGNRWEEIGRASRTVEYREDGKATVLERIPVLEGTYGGVLISMDSSNTAFVSINELYLTQGTEPTFDNATVSQLSGGAFLTWEHEGFANQTVIYYGTQPGVYTDKVIAPWRGYLGTRVYNLVNDKKYYFKIAANVQGKIYYSKELSVVPKSSKIAKTLPEGTRGGVWPYYSDLNLTPNDAFDGDIYTSWYYTNPNYPPNDDGSLSLYFFRNPTYIESVQIVTQYSPVALDRSGVREDEYTITSGWDWNTGDIPIGQLKTTVRDPGGDGIVYLETIPVKPGYYHEFEIHVKTTGRYVSVNEVIINGKDPNTSVTGNVYGNQANEVTQDVYAANRSVTTF
ncbi:hypothetical protein [Paenibacillus shenyangensis]|uniref:hypothetical protein n=1 Tax=Paenibacillus sp. A9 TaxID=1284352 RepID=UPI000377E793|nr:hypothetical protein [Paenibacillus sp. A9]